uniref:NADH dehydrogenase subunit 4L n=1 Tax=Aphaenogaster famelica TaxID=255788 RepID=A0A6B9BKW5_9HYME|nr:NADH dehydrogenase subunit 4L [Aphaenogaster famelica]QGW36322.1 NADH dehydrogenase subunit 4L [Aphaenogaster famelica]
MMYDILIYMHMVIMSLFLLIFMYKYMLILLMLIEMVVVNISLLMFMYWSMFNLEFFMIYYLIFSVCESVLGMGLLVMIIRYYGSDLYFMFNISKF